MTSSFCTLIQTSPTVESFGGKKDSHSPPGKSHRALSVPLFNGSIAIPTPSCLRALFPYGYCAISYSCGCLSDINAYFPCQPSRLNWIEGGEREWEIKWEMACKGKEREGDEHRARDWRSDLQSGVKEAIVASLSNCTSTHRALWTLRAHLSFICLA